MSVWDILACCFLLHPAREAVVIQACLLHKATCTLMRCFCMCQVEIHNQGGTMYDQAFGGFLSAIRQKDLSLLRSSFSDAVKTYEAARLVAARAKPTPQSAWDASQPWLTRAQWAPMNSADIIRAVQHEQPDQVRHALLKATCHLGTMLSGVDAQDGIWCPLKVTQRNLGKGLSGIMRRQRKSSYIEAGLLHLHSFEPRTSLPTRVCWPHLLWFICA